MFIRTWSRGKQVAAATLVLVSVAVTVMVKVPEIKHRFGFQDGEVSMAPSQVIGPIELEGIIQQATWYPAQFMRGIPRMSGSLGQDRTIPAHYKLQFQDVEVSDRAQYSHLGGRVVVYHPQDDGFLTAGMHIRIYGLGMAGDEGGDYIYYDRVEILGSSVE